MIHRSLPSLLALPLVVAPQDVGERADALFERWNRPDSPGAAVAVVHRGETVLTRGYGSAQVEHGVAITPETIFHAASVSKQFTAFAVCLLEAEGALSLDDPLQRHVPEVPDFGHEITLRHLLHHTSGLRDQWETLAIAGWRLDDVITTEHVLTMVEHQRELNFAPGEEHLYCNTGYTLAAEVVGRVSGKPFPEFCRERIFEPLGMTRTHFHDDHRTVVEGRAYSYRATREGLQNAVLSYANCGATSLFTTAPDLLRWLQNLGSGSIGGPDVRARMRERFVLNDGKQGSYALGISLGVHRGRPTMRHAGGDAGFRSYVAWFPEEELGVAVLANVDNLSPPAMAMKVADLFLSEASEDPRDSGTTDDPENDGGGGRPRRRDAPPAPTATPGGGLEDFVGRYWSEELGTFYDVSVAAAGLEARHRRHGRIALKAQGDDAFRGNQWFFGRVEFTRGEEGAVNGFLLQGGRVKNLRFDRR